MGLKILAFQGSPRKGGNSDLLLEAFLEAARGEGASAQKIYLCEKRISPCLECGGCDNTGKCILKDDMSDLYQAIEEADILVLSSPIFFYNITAYTQAFIERAQAFWVRKYVLKKPPLREKERLGLFFALGATRGAKLFEGAIRVVRYFFDAVYARYEGGLFYREVEKKGDVLKHPKALSEARHLGRLVGKGISPDQWPVNRSSAP